MLSNAQSKEDSTQVGDKYPNMRWKKGFKSLISQGQITPYNIVKHGLHVCSLPQPAGHQPPQQLGQSFNERRILNFFTRTFPRSLAAPLRRPSPGRSAGNISQADCEFSNFTLYTWLQTLYLMNIDLQWVTWEASAAAAVKPVTSSGQTSLAARVTWSISCR